MKPNILKIQKLVDEKFEGNKTSFARSIGVKRSQVSVILNDGVGAGIKFFGGLIKYCDEHNLNFREYIFLQ
ncbi:hypothetical protein [Marinisporobacter balticus]|uniref:Cro/C1-type helix-turn-helix DNA-binding protein n=1 Tax=Marinisporobacter balticus TaxID=2018667 RepID=A0A4R2K9W3_9FIRM|nr:hypothetical protein [Marinisporobacter balticus]TCO69544.1 hypothetical protein EV214_13168 [Marinisporobacter balticus]